MTFLQSVSSGTACLSKTLYLRRHGVFNSPHIILPIFFICSKSFSKKLLFSACPCSPCAFPISIPPFRNKLSVQDCLYCHYPMNGSPELLISLRRLIMSNIFMMGCRTGKKRKFLSALHKVILVKQFKCFADRLFRIFPDIYDKGPRFDSIRHRLCIVR